MKAPGALAGPLTSTPSSGCPTRRRGEEPPPCHAGLSEERDPGEGLKHLGCKKREVKPEMGARNRVRQADTKGRHHIEQLTLGVA